MVCHTDTFGLSITILSKFILDPLDKVFHPFLLGHCNMVLRTPVIDYLQVPLVPGNDFVLINFETIIRNISKCFIR